MSAAHTASKHISGSIYSAIREEFLPHPPTPSPLHGEGERTPLTIGDESPRAIHGDSRRLERGFRGEDLHR